MNGTPHPRQLAAFAPPGPPGLVYLVCKDVAQYSLSHSRPSVLGGDLIRHQSKAKHLPSLLE